MTRPTYKNYTQADLGEALKGTEQPIDLDRYYAELETSEEWARLEEEAHLKFLARINSKAIQEEAALFIKPKSIGRRTHP